MTVVLVLLILGCSTPERTRVVKIQVASTDPASAQETYVGSLRKSGRIHRDIDAKRVHVRIEISSGVVVMTL